jgi:hypothetical protein
MLFPSGFYEVSQQSDADLHNRQAGKIAAQLLCSALHASQTVRKKIKETKALEEHRQAAPAEMGWLADDRAPAEREKFVQGRGWEPDQSSLKGRETGPDAVSSV